MCSIVSNKTKNLALVFLAVIAAGCSSGPRVITNSAPDFDVASYRTFGFMRPLSTDRAGATSIMSSHLISATTNELEMAGLRRSDDNPDLLINFFVTTREVLRSNPQPHASVSVHHRAGRYGTWGGYSMGMSTAQVTQSTEGTLSVDIVSASLNQLVWEGAATARVTDSRRENLEETINGAIQSIFAQFP